MGSILGGPSGSSSQQKFPSWTAPYTRFAWEGQTPGGATPPTQGLIGDYYAGSQAFPSSQLFSGLAGQVPNAQQAGFDIRNLASNATGAGYNNLSSLAQQGMGGAAGNAWLQNLVPQLFGSANDFAGRVNQGAAGFGQGMGAAGQALGNAGAAFGAANQVFGNAMQPTEMNPFFQNAMKNQVTPQVNAAFAARGLGGGGGAINALSEAGQNLASQFGQMQIQQQLGALAQMNNAAGQQAQAAGLYAPLAGGLGQLGIAGGQLPGQIYNQFQQGNLTGMQGLAAAGGLQTMPLGIVGAGGDVYNQGLNLPLGYQQNLYNFTRDPAKSMQAGLGGTLQNSSSPQYRGIFGIPKS